MGRTRTELGLVCVVGLLSAAAAGCASQQYRISTTPSLRPVDAARPLVVFSQIQGRACGTDAVLGAIRDMKRLDGVDGYLEVVIEDAGEGDKRCARVTAYPFRYGTSTDTPLVRASDEQVTPHVVAGREVVCTTCATPAPVVPAPAVDCAQSCARVSVLVESGTIKQALVRDRCLVRCNQPDAAFAACIAAANDAPAAASCWAETGNPANRTRP
jgi:hypothetical protein